MAYLAVITNDEGEVLFAVSDEDLKCLMRTAQSVTRSTEHHVTVFTDKGFALHWWGPRWAEPNGEQPPTPPTRADGTTAGEGRDA